MMTEISKWESDETVGAQRFCRVRHTETGQVGYRKLAWKNQGAFVYGQVYSGPHCMSAATCRELGIPESEADTVLCPL